MKNLQIQVCINDILRKADESDLTQNGMKKDLVIQKTVEKKPPRGRGRELGKIGNSLKNLLKTPS